MALTGTLADINVIDLLKFPHATEKSGELIIAGMEDEARTYYDKGQIYHSVCGDSIGMDAIIELLRFDEGEFEFRNDVTTNQQTVNTAIDELIPHALALKEKLGAQQTESNVPRHEEEPIRRDLAATVEKISLKHSYINHVALYRRDGTQMLTWDKDSADESFNAVVTDVIHLLDNHPREGLHKIYMSHAHGTTVACLLNADTILLMDSDVSSSLGMLSLASARITQSIVDSL